MSLRLGGRRGEQKQASATFTLEAAINLILFMEEGASLGRELEGREWHKLGGASQQLGRASSCCPATGPRFLPPRRTYLSIQPSRVNWGTGAHAGRVEASMIQGGIVFPDAQVPSLLPLCVPLTVGGHSLGFYGHLSSLGRTCVPSRSNVGVFLAPAGPVWSADWMGRQNDLVLIH